MSQQPMAATAEDRVAELESKLKSTQNELEMARHDVSTAQAELARVELEWKACEDELQNERLDNGRLKRLSAKDRILKQRAEDRATEVTNQLRAVRDEKLQSERSLSKLLEKLLTQDVHDIVESEGKRDIDAGLAEVYLCQDKIYQMLQAVSFPNFPGADRPEICAVNYEFESNTKGMSSPGDTDERVITLSYVLDLYLASRTDSQDEGFALNNIIHLHHVATRELRGQGLKYGRQVRVKLLLTALVHRVRRSNSASFAICLILIRSLLRTAALGATDGISSFIDAAIGSQLNGNTTEHRDLRAAGLMAQIAAVRLFASVRANEQGSPAWIPADVASIALASPSYLDALVDASKSGLVDDKVTFVRRLTSSGPLDPNPGFYLKPDPKNGANICVWRRATPSGLDSLMIGFPVARSGLGISPVMYMTTVDTNLEPRVDLVRGRQMGSA